MGKTNRKKEWAKQMKLLLEEGIVELPDRKGTRCTHCEVSLHTRTLQAAWRHVNLSSHERRKLDCTEKKRDRELLRLTFENTQKILMAQKA